MKTVCLLLVGCAASAAAQSPSCSRADLTFTRFPLDGVNGRDYFVNNYVDADTGPGLADYTGATGGLARTYGGHRGIDIDIANFERMDDDSAVIRATAPGTVEWVVKDQFDRNSVWCGGLPAGTPQPRWNVVSIRHANGYRTLYGHMKEDSPTVAVGDTVAAGDIIGVVGSSGCSTDPHLHLEVQDCAYGTVDPFAAPDMWVPDTAYNPPSDVMALNLKAGSFGGFAEVRDPPPSVASLRPDQKLALGLTVNNVGGDVLQIQIYNPNGLHQTIQQTLGGSARRGRGRYWWNELALGGVVGTWRVEARMNGVLGQRRYFEVSSYSTGMKEIVAAGVPIATYQATFDDANAGGFRLEYADAYSVGGNAFVNAVFRKNTVPYLAYHGLTASQYQAKFDSRPAGWGPTSLDSYTENGQVRYMLVLKPVTGSWFAVHGRSESNWNTVYAEKTSQGFYPVQISVVAVGDQRYYSALFKGQSIGEYYVNTQVRVSDYQDVFNTQIGQSKRPMYLNAYTHNGVEYFAVIFASSVPWWFEARHGLNEAGLASKVAQNVNSNNNWKWWTHTLTGYANGNTHGFAAMWHQ